MARLEPPDDDSVRFGSLIGRADERSSLVRSDASLADALGETIRDKLGTAPCYVLFSGGCDSSLVLASATRECRAVGVPDPIPVTLRYPGASGTDESDYQSLVVDRLQLRDWIVLEPVDDADFLGTPSTAALQRHGVVWPPTLFSNAAVFEKLDPGLILTGEGGDEILGNRRLGGVAESIRRVVREHRVPPRHVVKAAVLGLSPRPVRERRERRELDTSYSPDWLDPTLRRDLIGKVVAQHGAEPLLTRRYPRYQLSLRRVSVGLSNFKAFAAEHGMRWEAPLLDPTFLGAVTSTVKWHEFRGRTIVLRHHFSDLIPSEIVERRTKALFNAPFFGPCTRAFAERWDGSGMPEGVDAEWLSNHWRSGGSHAGTAMLLQRAWLATEGGGLFRDQ